MPQMGLRLKFNVVLLALTAITLTLILWTDYRHESSTLMDAHAAHVTAVGAQASGTPVARGMLPDRTARRSLRVHLALAITLLLMMAGVVNATVQSLILRPVASMRDRLGALQRGNWRVPAGPAGDDELGALNAGFQRLGLEIDALAAHGLRAERLATLALVSKRIEARIAPEIAVIGEIAARLTSQATARRDGERLGRAAADILRAVHEFDAAFAVHTVKRPVADITSKVS